MPRFDRYLLSQLLVHFGFFALVLVGVYWINQAVTLFDQLMSDGQSAMVFLKISALTLPSVIRRVLPIAGFVATLYVTNKLIVESEIVVMQATGFSAYRMARPVMGFGLIVALMMAALVHVLVPLSKSTLVEERAALSENITAGFLKDGQFTHPSSGVTFYMTGIDDQGRIQGLFLEDARSRENRTIFTARTALFLRGETGPKLIMQDGMAQILNPEGQRLSVTRFRDFSYDLGNVLTRNVGQQRKLTETVTSELLFPDNSLLLETGVTPEELRYEIHSRVGEPFLSISVAILGFASLLLGGFSRLGLWRQIGLAIAILVVVQGVSTAVAQIGASFAYGWILAYLAPILALISSIGLLGWSGRARPVPIAGAI